MEGVDWMLTLVGLVTMIGFVITVWCTQLLIETTKRRETDEGEGPSTLGS